MLFRSRLFLSSVWILQDNGRLPVFVFGRPAAVFSGIDRLVNIAGKDVLPQHVEAVPFRALGAAPAKKGGGIRQLGEQRDVRIFLMAESSGAQVLRKPSSRA